MSNNFKKKSIMRKEKMPMNINKNINLIISYGQLPHLWENILTHLESKYKIQFNKILKK